MFGCTAVSGKPPSIKTDDSLTFLKGWGGGGMGCDYKPSDEEDDGAYEQK